MPKLEWKHRKAALRAAGAALLPGIEESVALREAWSHKAQGTPETHERAAREATREGALARLHASGAIDAHQLAAAQEIALAHSRIIAGVAVRTAKWEKRFNAGRPGDGAVLQGVGEAILDRAYSKWRAAIAPHGAMILAIVVDDVGLTIAARRYRMSNRRAKMFLVDALDRWRRR